MPSKVTTTLCEVSSISSVTSTFMSEFNKADLIISKGQANFEIIAL